MKIKKVNKNIVKNWTIFLILAVLLFFNSCSNFLSFEENKTAVQNEKCIITVSSDFSENEGLFSRAAFPNFVLATETLYFAEISYTSASSKKWLGEDSVCETAVVIKNNYSDEIRFVFCVPQETSLYTLTLYACPKQTESQISAVKNSAFAQGSTTFTLSAGQKSLSSSLNIELKPQETSGTGSVNLPLSFDSVLGIVAAKVNVTKDGVSDSSGNNYGFEISVSESAAMLSAENAPAGTYLAIMKFYKSTTDFSSVNEVAVNFAVQQISVYSGMTSDCWFVDGKKIGTTGADGVFTPSALELTKYDFTELYVLGSDAASGEIDGKLVFYNEAHFGSSIPTITNVNGGDGSMTNPFATVQKAVDKIAAAGDTSKKYTIYVDGTVTAESSSDFKVAENGKTFIYINPTNQLDLTIKGFSQDSKAVLNANQNENSDGNVLEANNNVSLTLENLKITGGKRNGAGGGICFENGNLTLKNCVVTNNTTYDSGGGILFCGNAELIIEDSEISKNSVESNYSYGGGGICAFGNIAIKKSTVFNNSVSDDSAAGGGLYFGYDNEPATVNIQDSKIYNNSAKDGGAIGIESGLVTLSKCEICENTATGNGGAIFIRTINQTTEAKLTIKENVSIGLNRATGDGGAIYATIDTSKVAGKNSYVYIGEDENTGGIVITGNNANRGGAFYGADNARFVMNAGKVSENYSTGSDSGKGGGAMFIWGGSMTNYSTFTMNGGEISGNMAKNGGSGGAVHIDHSTGGKASFIMTGGLLSGNKAGDENGNGSNLGGAIYLKTGGQIKLGGSAVVDVEDDGNDIWLADAENITITDTLAPENNAAARNLKYTARITPGKYTVGTILIAADSGVTLEDKVGKFCVTKKSGSDDEWFITTEGKLSKPTAISSLSSVPDFKLYPKLTVSSGDEMNKLSGFVNNGNTMAGTTVTLLNDITLDSDFQNIGNTDKPFSGTFDGNGKKIDSGTASLWAIFYQVTGGTIKNLTSSGKFSMSGIVANLSDKGLIENCTNTATVTSDTYSPLGGVCAKMENSIIDRCVNKGSVKLEKSGKSLSLALGGICGSATGVIKNSTNYDSVVYTETSSNDSCFVGGILGTTTVSADVDTELYNCINIGDVSGNEESASGIGGILGDAYILNCSVSMKNCVNMGNSSKNAIAGKCVGTSKDKTTIDFTYYLEDSAPSVFAWNHDNAKAYSFKKCADLYMTTDRVTVGTFLSDDLIELLNAWVDKKNSSGAEQYLNWDTVDDRPSLVYE